MKSVTLTLSKEDHYTDTADVLTHSFQKGMLIKMACAKSKRVFSEVLGIRRDDTYSHTLTARLGYKASPKSQLRPKSKFSKVKYRIIN